MIPFKKETDIISSVNDLVKTPIHNNGLEEYISNYTTEAIKKIKYTLIIKSAIISFIALIISFYIDVAKVPFLGNVSFDIGKYLFPSWQPAEHSFVPFTFWWLPLIVYGLFLGLSFLAFRKLSVEVVRTPTSEIIDKIISSYLSIVEGISTALPLIGAAILLLSTRMGEEIFLGLSVPFEIKALIILALGKLFEPVFDQMGIEYQNVVSNVKAKKEKYFAKMQSESTENLVGKIEELSRINKTPGISTEDLNNYKEFLHQVSDLSHIILSNYDAINKVLIQFGELETVTTEKVENLKNVSESILRASKSLSDEQTITGLKCLESIIVKR